MDQVLSGNQERKLRMERMLQSCGRCRMRTKREIAAGDCIGFCELYGCVISTKANFWTDCSVPSSLYDAQE